MKVLILMPDSFDNPMGGMGEQCRHVVSRFSKDIQCTIITSPNQEAKVLDNIKIIPTHNINTHLGATDPVLASILMQTDMVTASMKAEKPDLIHAFDWSSFYASLSLKHLWNVPLVGTIQLSISKMLNAVHPDQEKNSSLSLLEGIELAGMLKADRLIQVSESYKRDSYRIFDQKTSVIPNGINLKEWQEKIPFTLPGTRPVKIVYLGRFAYMKGIQHLLAAKIPDNVDLIYIGGTRGSNPELQNAVLETAQNVDNIHYLGPLYGNDKIGALQDADAVIMPSIHEPFGIVALEALASKSILLSSFANGMGDFLTEDIAINCGITPESISQGIEKLSSLTEEEKSQRIEKGVNLCNQFDWQRIAGQIEQIYKNLCPD